MTLQPDGKIVAVGDYAYQNGILGSISLMRFNADGSPDKNFGINGMTIIKVTNGPDQAKDVALLSDGRIIVAGMPKKDFYDYGDSFFACFTSDGKLDKNFGNVGIVIISGEDIPILINAIAITADDKIIAAGGGTNPSHALVRYNNDGTPDLSFGENGIATIFFDNNIARAEANDVNVDKDGSIITGGTAYYQSGKRAISVCKFMHDGKADKDFGQGGFNYSGLDKGDAYGNTIAVQQNGKIVIAGSYSLNDSGEFVVNRYTSAGLLDSSFGINGFQITSFFEEDVANSVNIQNDGKIVVVGSTQLANKSFVDIARYYGDESKKQILITKIKKWIQHHNGFTWDANSNVSDYVVQRSYDGIHFSSIARVNANNNSALTYEDPTPLSGINYYRLQTTGINGTVNYSNVLVVSANENTITISPNPAKNSLYIEGLSSNKTKITVVDFSGNVKMQTTVNNNSYNLNIASLKKGNYLLKIETNDNVITKQFVKE